MVESTQGGQLGLHSESKEQMRVGHGAQGLSCLADFANGHQHFSGLFVLLCIGFGLSILTTIGEHIVYRLLLPRIKNKSKLQYWLHTSQVSSASTSLCWCSHT